LIRSMTGFGKSSFEVSGIAFDVELRSVNHRHLDVRVRVPRLFSDHEAALRSAIQDRLARGKVDCTISQAPTAGAGAALEVDTEAFRQLVEVGRSLAGEHGLEASMRVTELLALPGVARFVDPDLDSDLLERGLFAALGEALAAADAMRAAEGAALEREIRARLASVAERLGDVEQRAGVVAEAARERLRKRAEQLQAETGLQDDARLYQEIVIAADRLDITEEIVRLQSHGEQFNAILDEAERGVGVGRRLEFLLQEMGRETNTIGSKANDAALAHAVVEIKSELERIREQVLNIE